MKVASIQEGQFARIIQFSAEKMLREKTAPNTPERRAARLCCDAAISDGAKSDAVFAAACELGKALSGTR